MFEQFLRKTHNNGTHIHDRIDTSNELTNFVEELEDAASCLVGDDGLAFHVITLGSIAGCDVILGHDQDVTGTLREFVDDLGLSLVQLITL